jgi:16S rRNA (uracil1498-N3)-methyltransferase
MRRFYIDSAACVFPKVEITGNEARHMKNVLRLREGTQVILIEGSGTEHEAVITDISSDKVSLRLLATKVSNAESPVHITIAQGFLKDKKMDLLVRRLTELGANRFLPIYCHRTVARPKSSALSRRIQRWESIAKEALKQCRRGVLMEIHPLMEFQQSLTFAEDHDLKLAFWERGELFLNQLTIDLRIRSVFLLLGPEGGFSSEEMEIAARHGFKIVSLGPRILRAETATVSACAIVQFLFGDMGKIS